jgi:LmbE family N-acetylglucosaminyl deacetylase
MRLLVVSPHADDAELGCGGYIARTVAEGGEVFVALMTVSDINFRHCGVVSAETRLNEFCASMNALGVKHYKVLSKNLDGQMYTAPQSEFVGKLDDIQDTFKPDTVLIPLPSFHQDHRYGWEVGLAATRPSAAKHNPSLIAAYEYPASNWGDGAELNAGSGGIYVNVAKHWRKKLQSLAEYKTQMRGKQHLLSIEGVTALAKLRGLEAGFEKAELFHALRMRV